MNIWFIIAQILGAITICFEFASYQIKDKRKYLLVNGIGSAFWAMMFLSMALATTFSTQITLVVVGVYSSLRALVFWWIFAKDTPKRRLYGKIFLFFMIGVALAAGITLITQLPTTETIILQSVTLVFALGFVIGQYLPGKHPIRISVFLYAITLFLTQTPLNILDGTGIERWNIMGMLIESAKMASVLVFYGLLVYKHFVAKKLIEIKSLVACEVSKIEVSSSLEEIKNIMPAEKLEKLVIKMVKFEIATMDREMKCIKDIQDHTKGVIDDMKTVADVKLMLEKLIALKTNRLDQLPIPKLSNVKTEMKEVMFGKSKDAESHSSEETSSHASDVQV